MIKKWEVTYPCFSGAEKRQAYIYLPKNYRQDSQRRYPVLYMFDGQNVFFDDNATYGKSWGMGKYLQQTRQQLIVVAVACNTHPDNGRLSEYTPFLYNSPDFGGVFPPRADETLDWYINTLKPYIDQTYRTLPQRQHTFIGGSSMGGLMSLYAVLAYNHIFSRAMALSPTLDADFPALLQLIQESHPQEDTVIYMDYGTQEFSIEPMAASNFADAAMALATKKIQLSTRIVPQGTHQEASWERQLPFAIPTILYEVNSI